MVEAAETVGARCRSLVMIEDDNLRLMTPAQFNARTQAWKRRRQRWAPRPRSGSLPLVPLLALVGANAEKALLEDVRAFMRALETLSDETNTELELELSGNRVGQVQAGEVYQFAFSLPEP